MAKKQRKARTGPLDLSFLKIWLGCANIVLGTLFFSFDVRRVPPLVIVFLLTLGSSVLGFDVASRRHPA